MILTRQGLVEWLPRHQCSTNGTKLRLQQRETRALGFLKLVTRVVYTLRLLQVIEVQRLRVAKVLVNSVKKRVKDVRLVDAAPRVRIFGSNLFDLEMGNALV